MKDTNKLVIIWLYSGCILISLMVIIGGVTRLTHSGLSIVEWKPIVGIIPPLNEQEWLHEFYKYKQSPEFIYIHHYFTLSDFKKIFFWEYLHRLIGRIIGIVFFIPFCFFTVKGYLKPIKLKVYFILLFGFFQGLLGWFMVKSGLVDNPHVSHYRLAAHFLTALFLISYIYYTILSYKHGETYFFSSKSLKNLIQFFSILLIIQITYGAFVSGLKAGLFYNTFPKMGSDWLPATLSYSWKQTGIISLFENIAFVQFIHRVIGFLILISSFLILFFSKRFHFYFKLDKEIKTLLFLIFCQFTFGVFTLLYQVPLILGIIHQFMAILIVLQLTKLTYFSRTSNFVVK